MTIEGISPGVTALSPATDQGSTEVSKQRFNALQVGRGLASLIVLLYHNALIFNSEKYWSVAAYNSIFGFGHSGVQFFFVLSGFIIYHAHQNDIGHRFQIGKYLWSRTLRVYPPYWIITAVFAASLWLSGNSRLDLAYNSILLIGKNNDAIIPVAWTLFNEVVFYVLFISMLFSRLLGWVILSLWFTICLLHVGITDPFYGVAPINILFGFGMVTFAIVKSERGLFSGWQPGIMAFLGLALAEMHLGIVNEHLFSFSYGIASIIFIIGTTTSERKGEFRAPKGLLVLGDASYSLYLVHYPLLSFLAKIFTAVPFLRTIPHPISFFLLALICVAFALLFHFWCEKPLLELLRMKIQPNSKYTSNTP